MKSFSMTSVDIQDENHPFGRRATVLNDRTSLALAKVRRAANQAMEQGTATPEQILLCEETDAAVQASLAGMPRS